MHLFDGGWNRLRDTIFANQKRLGIMPETAKLTEWNKGLPEWDKPLSVERSVRGRRSLWGLLAYADHEIGRLIQSVEDMGPLDNTLVIYIAGDNGASPEGTLHGTPNEFAAFNRVVVPIKDQLINYPFGDPTRRSRTMRRAGPGDGYAVPVDEAGRVALRRDAAGHGDVVAGPDQRRWRSPPAVPPCDRRRADHPEAGGVTRRRPSMESHSGRSTASAWPILGTGRTPRGLHAQNAIFRDARQARHLPRGMGGGDDAGGAAVGGGRGADRISSRLQVGTLQLHDDPTQAEDIAAKNPEKLRRCRIFSMRSGQVQRVAARQLVPAALEPPRPDLLRPQRVHLHRPDTDGQGRRAECWTGRLRSPPMSIPQAGADGMLVTDGGRFGGYGLFLSKGEFEGFNRGKVDVHVQPAQPQAHHVGGPLPGARSSHHHLRLHSPSEPGLGKGGTGVLKVDGKEVARNTMENSTPITFPEDETFDIGSDTRTGVAMLEYRYDVPFKFTGTINRLTFDLEPQVVKKVELEPVPHAAAKARD